MLSPADMLPPGTSMTLVWRDAAQPLALPTADMQDRRLSFDARVRRPRGLGDPVETDSALPSLFAQVATGNWASIFTHLAPMGNANERADPGGIRAVSPVDPVLAQSPG